MDNSKRLFTLLYSIIKFPILQPPSSSGAFHDSVTDLPDVLDTCTLPGGEGLSENKMYT